MALVMTQYSDQWTVNCIEVTVLSYSVNLTEYILQYTVYIHIHIYTY